MKITRRHLLAGTAACALPLHARADDALSAVRERAAAFDQSHSLIVIRNGDTLVEARFRGPALDAPANIKSVSKTIVATLLGIAIDKGTLPSVTATLGDVAPGLVPPGADPRVAGITLEDLVTLRAGLERTSGPNYGQWVSSRNWVADALSRSFVAEPGGRMLYSTGSTHVLGAVLAETTGRSLLDLARDWLARPLAIDIPPWTRDPQGYYMGGNEMALSPRSLARFGEMIRQGGTWNGVRIVSQDWLRRSFQPVTRSPWSGLGYGYGWFTGRASGIDYALARGYGGQVLAIAPEAGLTIAITSDPTRPARSGGYFGDLMSLIESDIIAALARSGHLD
jgi:CubicO group peptidase (beta-lactamase class C family)